MKRHLAMLRSICETLNGGRAHCACGKPVSDDIHFKSKEYNALSKDKKLTEWRGMIIKKDEA
jgi:hypothetical protein